MYSASWYTSGSWFQLLYRTSAFVAVLLFHYWYLMQYTSLMITWGLVTILFTLRASPSSFRKISLPDADIIYTLYIRLEYFNRHIIHLSREHRLCQLRIKPAYTAKWQWSAMIYFSRTFKMLLRYRAIANLLPNTLMMPFVTHLIILKFLFILFN